MNSTEQIFVLKDGKRLGPYSMDDLLDQIERGAISYEDACLRTGATECERVREILDWDPEPAVEETTSGPAADFSEDPIAPFDPGPSPSPEDDLPEEFEDDDFDLDEEILETLEELEDSGPPSNPNTILYAGHPSLLSFPRTLFLVAVTLGGGIWFRDTSNWIFFAGLVVALFAVSWILLERSMHLYLITPRRAEIVTGLIAKSSNEVRIEDIRAINVVKSGLTGLLGVGTVEFDSSGGSSVEVAFKNVWAANRIKGLVRRLQDALAD
jgi:hypothetical protein